MADDLAPEGKAPVDLRGNEDFDAFDAYTNDKPYVPPDDKDTGDDETEEEEEETEDEETEEEESSEEETEDEDEEEEEDDEEEEESSEEEEEPEPKKKKKKKKVEVDPLDAMRAQLLASATGTATVTEPATDVVAKTEPVKKDPEPAPDVIPEYVTAATLEATLDSPEAFNKLLHGALKQYVESQTKSIQTGAIEVMQTALPGIVETQVAQHQVTKASVDAFYKDNAELDPYRPIVANNVNAVHALHPEWTLEQLMPEAAKLTYAQLQLTKRAAESAPGDNSKNTGLRKKGKRGGGKKRNRVADKRSDLQKELDEL